MAARSWRPPAAGAPCVALIVATGDRPRASTGSTWTGRAFAFNDGSSTWTTTRAGWIAFVQSLSRVAARPGARCSSVTVPAGAAHLARTPPATGSTPGRRSARAVDRLRVMAYDYSPSRPGPIAPYPWVQHVVAHAVTQVAAGKIQIGVPAYGRDWWTATCGTCPTLAPAGATSAQSATFFSDLSWAERPLRVHVPRRRLLRQQPVHRRHPGDHPRPASRRLLGRYAEGAHLPLPRRPSPGAPSRRPCDRPRSADLLGGSRPSRRLNGRDRRRERR